MLALSNFKELVFLLGWLDVSVEGAVDALRHDCGHLKPSRYYFYNINFWIIYIVTTDEALAMIIQLHHLFLNMLSFVFICSSCWDTLHMIVYISQTNGFMQILEKGLFRLVVIDYI